MNQYDRFLNSLLAEFKIAAQTEVYCLWADLEELEEASDERVRAEAYRQTCHRLGLLEHAADAARATRVLAACYTLEHILGSTMYARAETRTELFVELRLAMTKLAEALYSIEVEDSSFEGVYQSTDADFAESVR